MDTRGWRAFPVRRSLLVLPIGGLAIAGGVGWAPRAFGAEPLPDKDYLAISEQGNRTHPFAILEKPKGAPIGAGADVEIEAPGLRVSPIEAPQVDTYLRRLPELDQVDSRMLPPGFKVYADGRYVQPSYAGGSHRYRITFTDPVDARGTGGGSHSGGDGVGGNGGGGGSM